VIHERLKREGRVVIAKGNEVIVLFIHRDLSFGRGQTAPVRGAEMPAAAVTEPWDGKDGVLPPADDVDLSDVDLDKDEL
jgi:hypothetical protein